MEYDLFYFMDRRVNKSYAYLITKHLLSIFSDFWNLYWKEIVKLSVYPDGHSYLWSGVNQKLSLAAVGYLVADSPECLVSYKSTRAVKLLKNKMDTVPGNLLKVMWMFYTVSDGRYKKTFLVQFLN